DTAGRETSPAPQNASLIQICGDGLDAQRPAMSTRGQVKDQSHNPRLALVNDEDLLVLVAPPFLDLCAVAEGWARAVPEALPGILQHRAMHMLGVLAGLVLIENVEQLAEHFPARVMRHLLGDRDEL